MRSEEFITKISQLSKDNDKFEELRKGIPLGTDAADNIVLSQRRQGPIVFRHTCVTGVKRTSFIRRLMITLSCLYEKDEACFLVLSPRAEYGELLRLKNIDATVPYLSTKEELAQAKDTISELLRMRETGKGYPRLFVILDGLDELDGCNANGDFEEYREIIDIVSRKEDVHIICGVDLMKSVFSGYPGTFVGIGNCLVSTREEGKADVTYVGDDTLMSLPTPMDFPDAPSFTETIIFLNSLQKGE
ncbi:MAG: hypothetical protein IKD47_03260 [Clostridia bacterium]|nr:hypothetical protein [Clostridia bacterium]